MKTLLILEAGNCWKGGWEDLGGQGTELACTEQILFLRHRLNASDRDGDAQVKGADRLGSILPHVKATAALYGLMVHTKPKAIALTQWWVGERGGLPGQTAALALPGALRTWISVSSSLKCRYRAGETVREKHLPTIWRPEFDSWATQRTPSPE